MITPHESRVTPWRAFESIPGAPPLEAVRIWVRLTPFGMWQAHEWRRPDGVTWRDDWIPSCGRRWPANATPSTEDTASDPAEIMAEALRAIREGHNDPRSLARETLERVEGCRSP